MYWEYGTPASLRVDAILEKGPVLPWRRGMGKVAMGVDSEVMVEGHGAARVSGEYH